MELIVIIITSVFILLLIYKNRKLSNQISSNTNKMNNEIIECKQSKRNLTESEESYRYLIDNSMVGIFNSDLNGQFIFVNTAMSRMFDFDNPLQMTGKMSLNHWKDLKQREQFLTQLNKYGHISNFEAEGVTHIGRKIHIIFSATLHDDIINGMVMDITEKKLAEQKNIIYQQRLKTLASQLIIAEEKERHRIAIGLHDHIGQSLVFFRIQLDNLRKQVAKEKALKMIDELSHSFLHMIQDIKELVFELSSPLLNEIGLSSAISQFLNEQIGQKYNLEVEFNNYCLAEPQNIEIRTILFRNVRELLFNIVKHAHATKVIVSIESNESKLIIIIQDDGIGYEVDPIIKIQSSEIKFGLFSISERMDDMSGSLTIESEPGKGYKAILVAPLL
ncbi:MAG: PAS domain S-box protein [Gammaproteobacteria bacterium]|nr:PAS domain S-box protein [Gammaproteobacteria bacterium]